MGESQLISNQTPKLDQPSYHPSALKPLREQKLLWTLPRLLVLSSLKAERREDRPYNRDFLSISINFNFLSMKTVDCQRPNLFSVKDERREGVNAERFAYVSQSRTIRVRKEILVFPFLLYDKNVVHIFLSHSIILFLTSGLKAEIG